MLDADAEPHQPVGHADPLPCRAVDAGMGGAGRMARQRVGAMNLEGAYGLFIYVMIPVAFIIVLGSKTLGTAGVGLPEDDLRPLRLCRCSGSVLAAS